MASGEGEAAGGVEDGFRAPQDTPRHGTSVAISRSVAQSRFRTRRGLRQSRRSIAGAVL